MPARQFTMALLLSASSALPMAAPVLAAAVTPTIQVTAHRPDHGSGSVLAINTLAHLEVIVLANGQPVAGNVAITFWDEAACAGLSQSGEPVPLIDGKVDGPRAYGLSAPGHGSFRARYLGTPDVASVTSPCVDVTWKAPLSAFESAIHLDNHAIAPSEVLVGVRTHLWSRLAGEFGPVEGTWRSYAYTNSSCSGSGDERISIWAAAHTQVEGFTTVGGFGGATFSAPGTYSWQAHFSGGAAYLTRTGACQRLSVKAVPTLTAAIQLVPGQLPGMYVGSRYMIGVSASGDFGTPTGSGSVVFHTLANCQGLGFGEPVTLSGGRGQVGPKTAEIPGYQSVRFSYFGNGTYVAGLSPCVNLNVQPAPPTSAPASATPTTAPTTPASVQPTSPPTSASTQATSAASATAPSVPPSIQGTAPSAAPVGGVGGSPAAGAGVPSGSPAPGATTGTAGSLAPVAPGQVGGPSGPDAPNPLAGGEPVSSGGVVPDSIGGHTDRAGESAPDPALLVVLGVALVALLVGVGTMLLATRRQARAASSARPGPGGRG